MIPQIESILKSLRTTLGETPTMERIYRRLPALAKSGVSFFLTGELGVGKELLVESVAQMRATLLGSSDLCLRKLDGRVDGCQMDFYPPERFADIFFHQSCETKTESPQTFYLANIEAFSLEMQRRFLRWWNDHPATMVIASTTQTDLPLLLEQDQLDEVLYYRLSGSRLEIPPLRKRPKDIQRLANRWLLETVHPYTNLLMEWDEVAVQFLTTYDWFGNRYELQSTILFAVQRWIEANPSVFEASHDVSIHSNHIEDINHSNYIEDINGAVLSDVDSEDVDSDNATDKVGNVYEDSGNYEDSDNYKDSGDRKKCVDREDDDPQKCSDIQPIADGHSSIVTDFTKPKGSRISFSADFLPPVIRGETPRESLSSRFRSRLSFADLVIEVIEKGLTEQAELAQMESRSESDHLYKNILEPLERELIRQVYEDCRRVRIHTANRLGINRNTLYKKLSDYELESDP